MELSEVAKAQYVSLTTFKRDGGSSATPVWITDLGDGTIGFTTEADSLKVRRIRNDGRVVLQACDMRGRVKTGAPSVDGVASVLEGADSDRVRSKIAAKYGWKFRAMIAAGTLRQRFSKSGEAASTAIVISPRSS
jgi:PPOX class probable F420-dependent enzyme